MPTVPPPSLVVDALDLRKLPRRLLLEPFFPTAEPAPVASSEALATFAAYLEALAETM